MKHVGIITGNGFSNWALGENRVVEKRSTPFGSPSSEIQTFDHKGMKVSLLSRHGETHIPPHLINYRANIWALSDIGARSIIALNAVGGIRDGLEMGDLCTPDQIIDYSHGRETTFFDGIFRPVIHIDVTEPYDNNLREDLLGAAARAQQPLIDGGVYGVTQGPRLETAAEIQKMAIDGCDLVGMTGMPEACLAKEVEIPYASICIVVNKAAGKHDKVITAQEMMRGLAMGAENALSIIESFLDARAAEGAEDAFMATSGEHVLTR